MFVGGSLVADPIEYIATIKSVDMVCSRNLELVLGFASNMVWWIQSDEMQSAALEIGAFPGPSTPRDC